MQQFSNQIQLPTKLCRNDSILLLDPSNLFNRYEKNVHEIRDPIHNFIKLNSDERQVLNSRPLQRLRHIHQLALTYLVYPSASYKRFEHSLGVMELATKIFDTITSPTNVTDSVRNHFPDLLNRDYVAY